MTTLFLLAQTITQKQLEEIVAPIMQLCEKIVPVLLGLVGAVGAIWCIVIGVKYAKAEEPQEHEKAKGALKNAIVGFVIIFVLLIMLEIGVNIFTNWYSGYVG